MLKVHQEVDTIEFLVKKKARFLALLCFVKFWAENPVSAFVNEKFCNKNLFFGLVQCSVNSFPNFILHVECV